MDDPLPCPGRVLHSGQRGVLKKELIMLVLGRFKEQTIHIGSDIVIKICECRCGHVQIGIEAPKEIPIIRGELLKDGAYETTPSN